MDLCARIWSGFMYKPRFEVAGESLALVKEEEKKKEKMPFSGLVSRQRFPVGFICILVINHSWRMTMRLKNIPKPRYCNVL